MTLKPIRRIQIQTLGDAIEPGVSDHIQWARATDGTEWVIKKVMDEGEQLAEAVASLLGGLLAVPIPEVAIPEVPGFGGRWWASRGVLNARHWSPEIQDELANLADLGRVLALDALLLNNARHDDDLLIAVDEVGKKRLWSYDYAASWVGSPSTLLARGLAVPEDVPGLTGLRMGGLVAVMRRFALSAREVSPAALSRVSALAVSAVGDVAYEDQEALEESLLLRIDGSIDIIQGYIDLLESA